MAVGAGYGLIPEEGGGGSSPRYRLIVPVWVRDGDGSGTRSTSAALSPCDDLQAALLTAVLSLSRCPAVVGDSRGMGNGGAGA